MDDDRSISDRLKELGYSHRRADDNGRHEVIKIATGESMGFFHAHEAVAKFLKPESKGEA